MEAMKAQLQWRRLRWWLLLIVFIVLVTLGIVYQKDIVNWIRPWARKVRRLKGGWMIWVALVIVISFPPLFGHELLGFVIGVVYFDLLWAGLLIMAAGTLIGEVLLFPCFKYSCTHLKEKWAGTNTYYAATLRAIERQPILIGLLTRFSALPGHYATPVFAQANMGWVMFIALCIVTLPYQLACVYLGYLYGQPKNKNRDDERTAKIIEYTVLGITIAVSIAAAVVLHFQIRKMRTDILDERGLVQDEKGQLQDKQHCGHHQV